MHVHAMKCMKQKDYVQLKHKQKNNVGSITKPNLKLYNRDIVAKTMVMTTVETATLKSTHRPYNRIEGSNITASTARNKPQAMPPNFQ